MRYRPKNPSLWLEVSAIFLLVLLGAFLRLYRLPETMMFQGDQGRDAMVAKRILIDFDLTLLGPITSIGNMYLGPLYYYFMVPWLALTYPNPVGPAYGVALLSIGFMPFFYRMSKHMLGQRAAVISLFLYAIVPVLVEYSRFSWNPNLAPIGGALVVYSLYRAWQDKKYSYLISAAIGAALLTHLHYVTLILLAPICIIFVWLWWNRPKDRKPIALNGTLALLVYLGSWLPLVAFNVRHNGIITGGFTGLFTTKDSQLGTGLITAAPFSAFDGRIMLLFAEVFSIPEGIWQFSIAYIGLIAGAILVFARSRSEKNKGYVSAGKLLALSLAITVTGVSMYRSSVFVHYILFALPLVIWWWSLLLSKISRNRIGLIAIGGLLFSYLSFASSHWVTFKKGGPTAEFYRFVAQNITPHIHSENYNLVLLANNRDYKGMNYRYFLEVSPLPPKEIDEYENLEQLVVIDEIGVSDIFSTNLYEINTPNLTYVANTFSLPGSVRVYILEKMATPSLTF